MEVLNQIKVAQRLHKMGVWLHNSYLFNQGDRLSIASHSKTVVLKESSPLMRSQLQRCLVVTPLASKDSYKGAKCLGSMLTLPNFLSCSVLAAQRRQEKICQNGKAGINCTSNRNSKL